MVTADAFVEKMRAAGLSEAHQRAFESRYRQLAEGATGCLSRSDLRPLDELPALHELPEKDDRELLRFTVTIRLNGGLGTTMGLTGPKSLVPVRDGLTFLELAARQHLALAPESPLVLMNSFHTSAPTRTALRELPPVSAGLPPELLQSKVPRIRAQDLSPASFPEEPEAEWCPPGHGDLYPTLWSSGFLELCLERGYRYAFVSNIDNLGATLDGRLARWFADTGATLAMEVAHRTPPDRKGGHLARLADGRLVLRELAQCPAEELEEFQDIRRYRFFNTNNLWLRLEPLYDRLKTSEGFLPLPLIVNRKTIQGEAVIQLETAMGSAISALDGQALLVPRSRFLPVKGTLELTLVASDLYQLDNRFRLIAQVPALPELDLDPEYFGDYAAWSERMTPVPSLVRARRLKVGGNVHFAPRVRVEGEAELLAGYAPIHLEPGTCLSGRREF